MGFDVIPAIDLRGGRCVRLQQGDYARETVYSDDPSEIASTWMKAGANVIHVVDLDGAAAGHPTNLEALRAIRRATRATVQYGGGVRDDDAIRAVLDAGADRVVLGTALVAKPEWIGRLCSTMADRVVVGIDTRAGRMATDGWMTTSGLSTEAVVVQANELGVRWGLFTDIERDGMLGGPNVPALTEVVRAAKFAVLASGGISSLSDLDAVRDAGAAGAIVGTALYSGKLDLPVAVARFR
jgi:phosphoribosylformimino-5-aminoimidazole carboxamide ribotide isomerase